MEKIATCIPEVYIIKPKCFEDERGWFMETYNSNMYKKVGIDCDFIQDNHSYSVEKGTLRGIHFQNSPMAQSKLVRCTRGRVYDVAVDLRKNSKTYLNWVGVELSADNKAQLFIPRGFGHAFLTLTENVEFEYKVDNYYSKDHDRVIRFDDPNIGIDWERVTDNQDFCLSEKDKNAPFISDSDCNFF